MSSHVADRLTLCIRRQSRVDRMRMPAVAPLPGTKFLVARDAQRVVAGGQDKKFVRLRAVSGMATLANQFLPFGSGLCAGGDKIARHRRRPLGPADGFRAWDRPLFQRGKSGTVGSDRCPREGRTCWKGPPLRAGCVPYGMSCTPASHLPAAIRAESAWWAAVSRPSYGSVPATPFSANRARNRRGNPGTSIPATPSKHSVCPSAARRPACRNPPTIPDGRPRNHAATQPCSGASAPGRHRPCRSRIANTRLRRRRFITLSLRRRFKGDGRDAVRRQARRHKACPAASKRIPIG